MTLHDVAGDDAVLSLGWTLVHFLWQGIGVALALKAVLSSLPRRSARVRYFATCIALMCMATGPVLTFLILCPASPAVASREASIVDPSPPAVVATNVAPRGAGDVALPPFIEHRVAMAPSSRSSALQTLSGRSSADASSSNTLQTLGRSTVDVLRPFLPWVVLVWASGVGFCAVWNFGGWIVLQRLRKSTTQPAEAAVGGAAARLARRLGITRTVGVLVSRLAGTPMVIGAVKPVILLPMGLLAELSPAQVESILAHELAHIRRHDYLVNLIQCLIETLLFYHPAVWWVSRQMRVERENCCDDLVVGLTADPRTYARALAVVAASPAPALLTAATGGILLARVLRVLGLPDDNAARTPRWMAGATTLIAASLLGVLASRLLATTARDPGEPPRFTVIDLGDGGADEPSVKAVNAKGTVIGSVAAAGVSRRSYAFIRSHERGEQLLGATPEGGRMSGIHPAALNDGDWVAGSSRSDAIVWTPSDGLVDLGRPENGGSPSSARGINNRNQVVGFYTDVKSVRRAFLWEKGKGLQDLGDLGHGECSAEAVNEAGHVVGGAGAAGGGHAVLWTSDRGILDLGDLPGGDEEAFAFAINDHDHVVGYSMTDKGHQAFYWSERTGLTSIGMLPDSRGGNIARSINNDDWVVGDNVDRGPGVPNRPFLWTPRLGMRDLNDLVDDESKGWRIDHASHVGARGEILAMGRKADGSFHYLLLTPVSGSPAAAPALPAPEAKRRQDPAAAELQSRFDLIAREATRLRQTGREAAAGELTRRLDHFRDRLAGKAENEENGPELHLVGMYEGQYPAGVRNEGNRHPLGDAKVEIAATDRPIVLALCAYEPVRWSLNLQPGVKIQKILLGGFHDQQLADPPAGIVIERHTNDAGDSPFFTYQNVGAAHQAAVQSLKRFTGLDVATFQGAYAYRDAPFIIGSQNANWTAQRLLNDIEPLYREARAFGRATEREGIAAVRFHAIHHPASPDQTPLNAVSVLADFSPLGPIAGKFQPLPLGTTHVAIDPKSQICLAIVGPNVCRLDLQSGQTTPLEVKGNGVPDLNMLRGLAFDPKRHRFILAGAGGDGRLYAYDPRLDRWTLLGDGGGMGLIGLAYSADEDRLYALHHGREGIEPPILSQFDADGHLIRQVEVSTALSLEPGALRAPASVAVAGSQLAVMLDSPLRRDGQARPSTCHLIDLRSGRVTYAGALEPRAVASSAAIGPQRLESLWKALSDENAATVAAAADDLAAAGDEAAAFLRARWSPIVPPTPQRVRSAVERLASADFRARETATADLMSMNGFATVELEKSLHSGVPPETAARIESLLRWNEQLRSQIDPAGPELPAEIRGERRAIQVLCRIATPAAVEQLWDLASRSPEAFRTGCARAGLREIGKL